MRNSYQKAPPTSDIAAPNFELKAFFGNIAAINAVNGVVLRKIAGWNAVNGPFLK